MSNDFPSLHIDPHLCHKLEQRKLLQPTQIQVAAIPVLLEGKDLIAQSQTGTGKTLAYLLPLIQRLDMDSKQLQAVIVSPTQELAMQIAAEAKWLGEGSGLRVQTLIGGANIGRQVERLRLHPHIVVGTPGRIAELINIRKLKMHGVRIMIVDEADQVFALSSTEEVDKLISSTLRDRQLGFFSATIPEEIEKLANEWMNSPTTIRIQPAQRTPEAVEHTVFACEARDKIEVLKKILRAYEPRSAIIFVREIDQIGEIEAKLEYADFAVVSLYGDTSKQDRAASMTQFREGKIPLLLATDVAARGLDIPDVSLVIHYDPPRDAEQYIHRSGRTGRAGRSGVSAMLITASQAHLVNQLAKKLGIEFAAKAFFGGQAVEESERRTKPASKMRKPTPIIRSSAGKAGSRSTSPSSASSSASRSAVRQEKSSREKDNKNKGAPRWLKKKQ